LMPEARCSAHEEELNIPQDMEALLIPDSIREIPRLCLSEVNPDLDLNGGNTSFAFNLV